MAKKYSEKASEKERLYIEAGYASVVERNPEKRLRLLLELTKKFPQEKQFYYELGNYYQADNNYAEAISSCERALALDPNFGPALNQAGYAYADIGDFEKAIQSLERYAAANPGQANPIDSIAELYFRQGKFDRAKAKYREALEIRPDFSDSCRGLAYIFAMEENYAETWHWLEEHIARTPTPMENTEARWLRAYFEYFLGRWDESLAEFSAIRAQLEGAGAAVGVAGTNSIMGYLYTDRGEYDPARKAYQAYIDWGMNRNPSYQTSWAAWNSIFLATVDLKQGRVDAAKDRLREVESLLPKLEGASQEGISLEYRLLQAEVFLAENLPEKAIEAGLKIVPENFGNMTPSSMPGYNTPFLKDVLARAYWKKGDLDKAIAEYERLTTIDLKSQVRYLIHPLYHYRLGRVYEDKGEKAKATEQYQKFLEYWKDADAGHPELADAKKRLDALGPLIKN